MKAVQLSKSTYYYLCKHPLKPTRPELREHVVEIFSRTANGCGYRQITMCLRHEQGAVINGKTVRKMMRELGLICTIRRERRTPYRSFKGVTDNKHENLIKRDFEAKHPWVKLGTDVTEFAQPWGKAYLAMVYDFATKEIVAWAISRSPNMEQQKKMLRMMLRTMPKGVHPILHSDMGWQYQHWYWVRTLKSAGIRQSMSRKSNCLDNAATEQVFGHLKDEFFLDQTWDCYEDFERDLDRYIQHWNNRKRQMKLKGLTPVEYRNQSLSIAP